MAVIPTDTVIKGERLVAKVNFLESLPFGKVGFLWKKGRVLWQGLTAEGKRPSAHPSRGPMGPWLDKSPGTSCAKRRASENLPVLGPRGTAGVTECFGWGGHWSGYGRPNRAFPEAFGNSCAPEH